MHDQRAAMQTLKTKLAPDRDTAMGWIVTADEYGWTYQVLDPAAVLVGAFGFVDSLGRTIKPVLVNGCVKWTTRSTSVAFVAAPEAVVFDTPIAAMAADVLLRAEEADKDTPVKPRRRVAPVPAPAVGSPARGPSPPLPRTETTSAPWEAGGVPSTQGVWGAE